MIHTYVFGEFREVGVCPFNMVHDVLEGHDGAVERVMGVRIKCTVPEEVL